jgi:flagellar hook-associated protein 1 FlgK
VTVSSTAGPVLVTGDVVHRLAVQTGAFGLDGSVLHDVGLEDSTGAFLAAPAVLDRGTVRGLLDVRDGSLVTASTNLDTVAGALRDAVNAIQTDPAARDLNGNATTAAPLFAGTGAHDLRVAIVDPRLIGAALSTEPGDNQNALLLADLRTKPPVDVVTAHGQASAAATAVGSVSLAQYLAGELGRVGSEATQADEIASHAQNLVQTLESQRASLSGVNLNEELTDLLKYQHSFQAAAQILNVTNTMLDELMRITI